MAAGSSTTSAAHDPSSTQETGTMLESLLSSPHDPVLLFNAEGRLEAFNRAAATEIGALEADWPAHALPDLKPVLDVLESMKTAGGAPVWVSGHGRAFLLLTNPTPAGGLLISMRDITDWRQLNMAQSDIMHVISHDIRTPLTIGKSQAEMLVEGYIGELTEEQQTATEKIALSIYNMVALIDNLQDAGRFDPKTGFYKPEPAPVDVAELMHKVLERHQLPAEIQHIQLSLTVDPALPIILADRVMLESAVGNLIDNAIKFSHPGGHVDVTVRAEGRAVRFAVRDEGPGIAEDDQDRIFERSVRIVAPGKRTVRGSGLGLYIVRSVVQRHGGDVWVESVVGEGSTFYLSLPVRAASPA